jgi:hypothetical protein
MVVTTLDGKVIYNKAISSVQYKAIEKINMSNFAKGFYNVTVYFDVKNKQTFKVIKL